MANMDKSLLESPYQMHRAVKQPYLLEQLNQLTQHHIDNCATYQKMLSKLPIRAAASQVDEVPYLPVSLFKMMALYSVPKEKIIKTLTSSGTTSQKVSSIFIDQETSILQTKALASIVTSFIGKKRLPMIIIDTQNVIKDRKAFNARGAGILGFSNFGRQHFYLLDENMNIRWTGLEDFLEQHQNEPILCFGFTYMVWQYFYQVCLQRQVFLDMKNSILIHGGGWKKLQEQAITPEQFAQVMKTQFGLEKVYNYYGMVEQVGSIFMGCEHAVFHAPDYADVIIRSEETLEPAPVGTKGLIQVLSMLPRSYPGHSLLTEDIGTLHGEDHCPCGRKGKIFTVEGRVPKAELRGCSDTHAYNRGESL